MRSSIFRRRKTPNVTIQGNITAMRYQNDVIRSVPLLHIRANLSMMFARHNALCHATRITLVMLVVNNVQKLGWSAKNLYLNPIDHLLDQLKRKVRAQSLQLNLRQLIIRVILQMCAAIPQQYIHRHIDISQYLAVDETPGGGTKYQNELNTTWFEFAVFCFKGVRVNPLI